MSSQQDNQQQNAQDSTTTTTPVVNGAAHGGSPNAGGDGGNNNNQGKDNSTGSKGNEDRKIFVGGIGYDVTNEDLSTYFGQFGDVTQAQVKYDRSTGRSRGFAFVEFASADICKRALNQREQQIKNKSVEVKPAKSRENKKVFVGGLPADHPEEELRRHFEQYGKVEDIEWPFDKVTKARRNFAFIVFEEEEGADRAASNPKQNFGTRECDVKKAVPQGKRFNNMRGGMGGMRGGAYGGGMGRHGNMGGMPNPAQWFGAGSWGQMGQLPYPGAAGATTGWNDWYNNAAAANYYAAHTGNTAGGPQYGYGAASSGYDYSQNQSGSRQQPPQQTAGSQGGRYAQQQY